MQTTETASKTCQACAHWKSNSADTGECRRHAPQTIVFEVNDQVTMESRFPQTSAQDWCGDYQAN